jgi:hypothetical protein
MAQYPTNDHEAMNRTTIFVGETRIGSFQHEMMVLPGVVRHSDASPYFDLTGYLHWASTRSLIAGLKDQPELWKHVEFRDYEPMLR